MALRAGSRLGSYEIAAPLGAGGMGEVYRAVDTRLGRQVAIKVLPSALSNDPDRLKRFEREARAASGLNHPNIVTIYDFGSEGSASYIAMELVEGSTLRELLSSGALPPRKALEIGSQLASGLARAHEAGIVHRDLKPENVMLRTDGFAKILDFGLAKLTSPDSTSGLTASETASAGTAAGVVMGTVGYMSPEQASGQPTDFRSDQFALGSMLYEMATGRKAFEKATAPETLVAIIREEPEPIAAINPRVPTPLRWIAERCLSKDPAERYASTADLAKELRTLLERLSEVTGAATGAIAAPPKRRLRSAILGGVGLVAAAALAGWLWRGSGGSRTVPTFRQVTFRRANIATAAFAPDGKTIAYTVFNGKSHEVFLVSQGSRESRPLGVPGWVLSISASGEMALLQGGKGGTLAIASIGGGAPRPVLESVEWADWAPDGKSMALTRNVEGRFQLEYPAGHVIYSTTASALGRVKVSPGGDRLALIEGGDLVAFYSAGRRTNLAKSVQEAAWSPSGREVLFTRIDRGVTDISAVSLDGKERLLASLPGDFTLFDISRDGRCLLERGGEKWDVFGRLAGEDQDRDLRWLDATVPGALSPDGKTLLFSEKDPAWQDATAYVRKMDGSPAVALGPGFAKSLSPDGKWALVLPSNPSPHLMLLPTGPGEPRILPNGDLEPFGIRVGGDFLPDGKQIVFFGQSKGGKPRIFVQDIANGMPRPISDEGVSMRPRSRVSPDGRSVLALAGGTWGVYPISGGKGEAIPGLTEEDFLIGWTADSRAVYVAAKAEENPMRLVTLNVASGERKPWKQIAHPATVNPEWLFHILMTPDGKSYVLTYAGWLSNLFVLEGLQ